MAGNDKPISKPPRISAMRTLVELTRLIAHLMPLFLANFALFMLCATLMFFYGKPLNTLTHAPVSFSETVYFCGVTGLTIGYGDVVATTPFGRVIVIVLGFLGVMMTGMLTSVAVLAVQRASEHAKVVSAERRS
jgi:voltage-gated potassium channel